MKTKSMESRFDKNKEFTVRDALNWSDKHRKLTSEGARVVHIQQLFKANDKKWRARIKGMKKEVKDNSAFYIRQRAYNQALDDLINQL